MMITIATDTGPHQVRATVIGKLAVHKGLILSDRYRVSHVPTGYAIMVDLDRKQALKAAKRLQVINWNFKRKAGAQKVREQFRKIRNELEAEFASCAPTKKGA